MLNCYFPRRVLTEDKTYHPAVNDRHKKRPAGFQEVFNPPALGGLTVRSGKLWSSR